MDVDMDPKIARKPHPYTIIGAFIHKTKLGVNFLGANFPGVNFRGRQLWGVSFPGGNCGESIFRERNLRHLRLFAQFNQFPFQSLAKPLTKFNH